MTVRVTTDDVIKAGFCVRGARRCWDNWGLTRDQFKTFAREGITLEELAHVDDYRVLKAIETAKARVARDG